MGGDKSLNECLNKDEQTEFFLLVGTIIEVMRDKIDLLFNEDLLKTFLKDSFYSDNDAKLKYLKGLHKQNLIVFDEWKMNVLQRIGEVLNSSYNKKISRKAVSKKNNSNFSYKVFTYPPIPTTLLDTLDEESCILVLSSSLLLLLSLKNYSSFSRVLLEHLNSSLDLPISCLLDAENTIAHSLMETLTSSNEDDDNDDGNNSNSNNGYGKNDTTNRTEAILTRRKDQGAAKKYAAIGLATVGGALIIGLTGGLAAPFVAAGVGALFAGVGLSATVVAAYLGALAASPIAVGSLFGIYGGTSFAKSMQKWTKEVTDFQIVPILLGGRRGRSLSSVYKTYDYPSSPSSVRKARNSIRNSPTNSLSKGSASNNPFQNQPLVIDGDFENNADDSNINSVRPRLSVVYTISGWLNSRRDVTYPWKMIDTRYVDVFAIQWEISALEDLGRALEVYARRVAFSMAKSEIIKRTFLSSLATALWPTALTQICTVIDNPWSTASALATRTGAVLADALKMRIQGHRPVTLVGYSLGARVIFYCLLELAKSESFGLVENVVLLGAPVTTSKDQWIAARSVVSGRLVNAYCTSDLILSYIYRSLALSGSVAGLNAVSDDVHGVENIDCTDIVSGHLDYAEKLGDVLRDKVGLDCLVPAHTQSQFLKIEDEELNNISEDEGSYSSNHDFDDVYEKDKFEAENSYLKHSELIFDASDEMDLNDEIDTKKIEAELKDYKSNNDKKIVDPSGLSSKEKLSQGLQEQGSGKVTGINTDLEGLRI